MYGPNNKPLGTVGSDVAIYCGEGNENPFPADTISSNDAKHDASAKKNPKAPLVPSAANSFSISLYKVQAVKLAHPKSFSIFKENSNDS